MTFSQRLVFGFGIGLVFASILSARADEPPRQAVPRVDPQSESLPLGAVARLGTLRFRHDWPLDAVQYLGDGKTLAAIDGIDAVLDRFRFWDAATGRANVFLSSWPR